MGNDAYLSTQMTEYSSRSYEQAQSIATCAEGAAASRIRREDHESRETKSQVDRAHLR